MNGGAMGTILPGRAGSVTWVFAASTAPVSHRERHLPGKVGRWPYGLGAGGPRALFRMPADAI